MNKALYTLSHFTFTLLYFTQLIFYDDFFYLYLLKRMMVDDLPD